MGEFYRQEEGGKRKLLANEKEVLFQAQLSVISLGSKGKVYVQITSLLSFFFLGVGSGGEEGSSDRSPHWC